MLREELMNCCKALRLSRNLVDNSERIAAQTNQAYLLELLQLEIAHREKSKRDRLVKNAGFYSHKIFDDYRFEEVKLPAGVTPQYLKQTQFIDEQKNLILYGNVGTGKTHLAIAIGIAACQRGLSVGFYRTANLVNQLADAKKTGKLSRLLTSLKKFDLLIFDEWGYVPMDREGD